MFCPKMLSDTFSYDNSARVSTTTPATYGSAICSFAGLQAAAQQQFTAYLESRIELHCRDPSYGAVYLLVRLCETSWAESLD